MIVQALPKSSLVLSSSSSYTSIDITHKASFVKISLGRLTSSFTTSEKLGFKLLSYVLLTAVYPAHLTFTKGSDVPVESLGGKPRPK